MRRSRIPRWRRAATGGWDSRNSRSGAWPAERSATQPRIRSSAEEYGTSPRSTRTRRVKLIPPRCHGKREAARPERLFSEAQQHQGILAAREEQGRVTALARNFAQDMDRLGFEPAEVMRISGRRFQSVAYRGFEEGDITHDTASSVSTRTTTSSGRRCNPHSLCSGCSHHQRPARRSSPGSIARVHGAQPILG